MSSLPSEHISASSPVNPPTEKPQHYAYLKEFRVSPCPQFKQHQCQQHRPFTCFYWHFANQRRRRPVRRKDGSFNYSPDIYCNKYDENTGVCPDGDECPYLHRVAGDVERKYHLRYYKTCLCVHATDSRGHCVKNGPHCAFAHGSNDLRPPIHDIRELHAQISSPQAEVQPGLETKCSFLPDEPVWQDLNYVLANYKTEQCRKPARLCRQGYGCPYYHNSKDRRRPPQKFKYRSTPCPGVKHADDWGDPDVCEGGDLCGYCHTRTEQQFHHEIYKSTRCNDMLQNGHCPRGPFCAFAHNDEESNCDREKAIKLGSMSLATMMASQLGGKRRTMSGGTIGSGEAPRQHRVMAKATSESPANTCVDHNDVQDDEDSSGRDSSSADDVSKVSKSLPNEAPSPGISYSSILKQSAPVAIAQKQQVKSTYPTWAGIQVRSADRKDSGVSSYGTVGSYSRAIGAERASAAAPHRQISLDGDPFMVQSASSLGNSSSPALPAAPVQAEQTPTTVESVVGSVMVEEDDFCLGDFNIPSLEKEDIRLPDIGLPLQHQASAPSGIPSTFGGQSASSPMTIPGTASARTGSLGANYSDPLAEFGLVGRFSFSSGQRVKENGAVHEADSLSQLLTAGVLSPDNDGQSNELVWELVRSREDLVNTQAKLKYCEDGWEQAKTVMGAYQQHSDVLQKRNEALESELQRALQTQGSLQTDLEVKARELRQYRALDSLMQACTTDAVHPGQLEQCRNHLKSILDHVETRLGTLQIGPICGRCGRQTGGGPKAASPAGSCPICSPTSSPGKATPSTPLPAPEVNGV